MNSDSPTSDPPRTVRSRGPTDLPRSVAICYHTSPTEVRLSPCAMGSAERRLPGSTRPPYACRRSGPFPRRGPIIMGRRLLLLVAMALTVGSGSRRAHAQPGEIPPAEKAESPSKVEPLPEPAPLPDPAEVAPAASPKPDPRGPRGLIAARRRRAGRASGTVAGGPAIAAPRRGRREADRGGASGRGAGRSQGGAGAGPRRRARPPFRLPYATATRCRRPRSRRGGRPPVPRRARRRARNPSCSRPTACPWAHRPSG